MRRSNSNKDIAKFNKDKSSKGKSFPRDKRVDEGKKQITAYSNPVEWYTKYRDIAEAAARIPFPYRPGMTLDLNSKNTVNYKVTIPGVFSIYYTPTVGYSESNTSPISQAAKELYARVRAAFSSRLLADAPDFIIYICALDAIFSNIALMKRVYRIVNSYSPDNYALPEALLLSMGFTKSEIAQLRLDWVKGWGLINELSLMSRKFTCPAVMDFINRHYWMNDNVYTDAPIAAAQYYMFMPVNYYRYEALDSVETPDRLEPLPIAGIMHSWDTMYDGIKKQIEALAASDDAYTISGYLMRAFENVPSFAVENLPQEEKLIPTYDSLVLTQIENARSVAGTLDPDGLYITQDPNTNAVIHKIARTASNTSEPSNAFLNLRSDHPDVDDVIEASRLQSMVSATANADGKYPIICGTECVTNIGYLSYDATSGNVVDRLTFDTYFNIDGSNVSRLQTALKLAAITENFDWHPLVCIVSTTTGNAFFQSFWDLFNPTVISEDQMANINRVCLYSEFNAFSI